MEEKIPPHTPNLTTSLKKTHVVKNNQAKRPVSVVSLKYLVVTGLFLGYIFF